MNDLKTAAIHTLCVVCVWGHVLWEHTAVDCVSMCLCVRAHAHRSVFITVYTLRVQAFARPGFLWAGRYTGRQGGLGSFLIISPSFLFLFWQSFALVWRPTSPPRPAYLFRAPEARLLMHLLLCSLPHRPALSSNLPWQRRTLTLSPVFVQKLFQYVFLGTVMFA